MLPQGELWGQERCWQAMAEPSGQKGARLCLVATLHIPGLSEAWGESRSLQ